MGAPARRKRRSIKVQTVFNRKPFGSESSTSCRPRAANPYRVLFSGPSPRARGPRPWLLVAQLVATYKYVTAL